MNPESSFVQLLPPHKRTHDPRNPNNATSPRSPNFSHPRTSPTLREIPPPRISLPLRHQLRRIHIPRPQLHPHRRIPPPILQLHPPAQPRREGHARYIARRGGCQRRHVARRILNPERRGAQDAAEVAEADEQAGGGGAGVLGEVVVVVPGVDEAGGDVGTGGEEEGREVRDRRLPQRVDGRQDDEAGQRDGQREDDVPGALALPVG